MSDEPEMRVNYGCQEMWQIRIGAGATDIDLDGPVRLGGPSLYLNEVDEPQKTHHDLEYAPVALVGGGAGTWLSIASNDPDNPHGRNWKIHRQMFHVFDVEFTNLGTIEIEGLELRPDGTTVRALWHVEPYEPDDEP